MEHHKIVGLRSMIIGIVLILLSTLLFSNATSTSIKEVNVLTVFFLLYVVFAAGLLLLVHGIFVHFPRNWLRVHHGISYTVLLLALVGIAYSSYQAIIQYF